MGTPGFRTANRNKKWSEDMSICRSDNDAMAKIVLWTCETDPGKPGV